VVVIALAVIVVFCHELNWCLDHRGDRAAAG